MIIFFLPKTHLGHILKPGDTALGYDVANANFTQEVDIARRKSRRQWPDLILVKKSYSNKKRKSRIWKLKQLPIDHLENQKKHDVEKSEKDYDNFLEELEEDPELRSQINLYKARPSSSMEVQMQVDDHDGDVDPVGDDENDVNGDEDDFPGVKLEELLEDLTLDDPLPHVVVNPQFADRHTQE